MSRWNSPAGFRSIFHLRTHISDAILFQMLRERTGRSAQPLNLYKMAQQADPFSTRQHATPTDNQHYSQ